MNKQQSAELLDELYHERRRLNMAIYHIRRHVLGMNFRKADALIKTALALKKAFDDPPEPRRRRISSVGSKPSSL